MELGFVGLGRMGNPMVVRLLEAGHTVHVFDTSEQAVAIATQRGAKPCSSARDVADKADIVLTSLPTPDIVQRVVLGEDGLARGSRATTVIDLSTTGPRTAIAVAKALADAGGRVMMVDSPVSGGVTGAEKGTLALMVSCPKATFEQIEPVLKSFGKIFHVGEEPGQGQTLKLANNLLAAAALAVSSEVMVMGVKAGLDPQTMIDVINVSSGSNTAIRDKFPPRGADPHVRLRLHHRTIVQGRAALRGGSGGDGYPDGGRQRRASVPVHDQRDLWCRLRLHGNGEAGRRLGRCGSGRPQGQGLNIRHEE